MYLLCYWLCVIRYPNAFIDFQISILNWEQYIFGRRRDCGMFRYEVHGDLSSGDSPNITISSVIALLKHFLLLDVQHDELKPGVHPSYAWHFYQVKTPCWSFWRGFKNMGITAPDWYAGIWVGMIRRVRHRPPSNNSTFPSRIRMTTLIYDFLHITLVSRPARSSTFAILLFLINSMLILQHKFISS